MLRLALFGGAAKAEAYARILRRVRATISVVIEPDAQQGTALAHQLGVEHRCDSLETLLTHHPDSFDALLIAGPDRFGLMLDRIAKLDKPVLLERPVSLTSDGAQAIQRLFSRGKTPLFLSFEHQFTPSMQTIKTGLDEDKLGTPGVVRIHAWHTGDFSHWRTYRNNGSWPALLREIGVACWVHGQYPDRVFALANQWNTSSAGEADYVQVHLGFPGGAMALIDVKVNMPGSGYYSVSVIGSNGAAYADDHHDTQLVFNAQQPTGLLTSQGDAALLGQLQAFLRAIEAGQLTPSWSEEIRTLEVAEAAGWSLETGTCMIRQGDRYIPNEAVT